MTFQWHNLLAADDDGIGNIIFLVVMIVLALVGHIAKKIQEKRQTDQADHKVAEAKRHHARQVAAECQQEAPRAVPGGADSAPQAAPRHPHTAAQQAAAVLASAAAAKAKPPPPPRQPVAGAKPQPARAHADLAHGIRQEVQKVRKHLSDEQDDRRRRFTSIKDLKSGIAAETPPAVADVMEGPQIRLNLTTSKAARTAIICAEVLGLPKALRTNPEPWEQ